MQAFATEAHSCKFSALFSPDAIADEARYDFLIDLAGNAELVPILGMLWNAVKDHLDTLLGDYELVDRFLDDVKEVVETFASVVVQTGPYAGFEAAIWPCYLDSLCQACYYLSIDELLLLCHAARVKVAIFLSSEDCYEFAGDT